MNTWPQMMTMFAERRWPCRRTGVPGGGLWECTAALCFPVCPLLYACERRCEFSASGRRACSLQPCLCPITVDSTVQNQLFLKLLWSWCFITAATEKQLINTGTLGLYLVQQSGLQGGCWENQAVPHLCQLITSSLRQAMATQVSWDVSPPATVPPLK